MLTAAHSGGLGDIVYAIPVMRKLGIGRIYVKRAYYFEPYGDLYRASCRLLEQQGFEVLPTDGKYLPGKFDPAITFDINLDDSRRQPFRGRNHILISYLNQYKLPHEGWKSPWLNIEGENEIKEPYSIIHLTPRWRTGSRVNWRLVMSTIKGAKYFVGFQNEWVEFCRLYGNVEWLPCNDILDMAILIRDADSVYCNQSVSLSLAQGLGKKYYLEAKPGKTNCLMFNKNENILL